MRCRDCVNYEPPEELPHVHVDPDQAYLLAAYGLCRMGAGASGYPIKPATTAYAVSDDLSVLRVEPDHYCAMFVDRAKEGDES